MYVLETSPASRVHAAWMAGMDLNLEAQAILPAAKVRDECQESQHKGDSKKQCSQPTEEPKPGEGHHGWNRGTQPAALHVEG